MMSVAWETGVEFDESERLQASISDDLVLSSCAGTGSPWKLDLFRMEVPGQSVLDNTEKHTSCNLKDLEKFHDISSSFEEILSDENDGIVSTLPKKVDKFELAGKSSEKSEFKGNNELRKLSLQGDCSDTICAQKRSRKPTQRYIEELEDSMLIFSKKRQGASSVFNNKNVGGRGCKKRCVVSNPVALPAEETSVIAIQVPFAAVAVQKECQESKAYDLAKVSAADCGKLMSKPKQSYTTPKTSQTKREDGVSVASVKTRRERLLARQQKRGEFVNSVSPKKRKDLIVEARPKKKKVVIVEANPKKKNDFIVESSPKKKNDFIVESSPKKKNDFIVEASPKKKNEFLVESSPIKRDKQVAVSHKKKDDCHTVSKRKKSNEDFFSSESLDGVSGRRKHHILWTIEEVGKLLDGVSQYGVGKWSRIKKLLFSSSSHRTCVDLKDKWRNLLKASGIVERGSRRQGGKKRHVAWRPLPESVIGRVCELAAMNPYPKDRTKPKEVLDNKSHDDNNEDEEDDSSDTSTDVTLNHYRKILRSISDN